MSGPVIVLSIMLFVAVLLAGLVYLYTAAGQAYREYQRLFPFYRQKLKDVRKDYRWIRKQTEVNWPIWPRPLLFQAIDHHTQVTLGRAEYAIEIIERCFAALEAIDPLDTGDGTLLNIPENIRRIRSGAANKKRLAEFDNFYSSIEEAKITIRDNQNEIVAIKHGVRQAVAALSKEFAASQNIQFFYSLGSTRYEDAIRNIEITQDCLNQAELEMHEAERADLVEWAAAYVYHSLGALSFDIFNLKAKSFSYPENYEADLVLEKLSALSDQLQIGLDYAQFNDWAYLVTTKNRLDALRAELEAAEDLLSDFDMLVQKFRSLVNQLSAIDIEDLTHDAIQAQRELEDYLGAPGEAEEWEKIRSPYTPPAHMLEEKKIQFTQEIEPAFQGMVIRQSELPVLIDSLVNFLMDIKKISALINHLEIWTRENRRCERETKQLLSSQGEVESLVRKITDFSNDSTVEIMEDCQVIQQYFKHYANLAFGPRNQAKFITLLRDVKALGSTCEMTIAQHEDAIAMLQIEAINTYRTFTQIHNQLTEGYQLRKPVIKDINWALVHQDYNEVMQQYDERGNRYTDILASIKSMKAVTAAENRKIRQCKQQFTAYQTKYNHINRQIHAMQSEISKDIEHLQKDWSRPLAQFIAILRAYHEKYRQSAEQLQLLQDDLTMEEAKHYLEEIDQNIAQLNEMRLELIDQAYELKRELDRLKKYVESLKNKKLSESNMKAWADANKNISYAEQTTDPVKAKEFLREATKILEFAHLYLPPVSSTAVNVRINKMDNQGMINIGKDIRQVNRTISRSDRKGRR